MISSNFKISDFLKWCLCTKRLIFFLSIVIFNQFNEFCIPSLESRQPKLPCWANITNIRSNQGMHTFDMLSEVVMFTKRFRAQITANPFAFCMNTVDMELQIVTTGKGFWTMDTLVNHLRFSILENKAARYI